MATLACSLPTPAITNYGDVQNIIDITHQHATPTKYVTKFWPTFHTIPIQTDVHLPWMEVVCTSGEKHTVSSKPIHLTLDTAKHKQLSKTMQIQVFP